MTTAALALHSLLEKIGHHKPQEETILSALVGVFEFEPSQSGDAAKVLHNLTLKLFEDVARLPHNKNMKRLLDKDTAPFSGLKVFHGLGQRVIDAKKNGMLRQESLEGLLKLHMTLAAQSDQPTINNEIVEIAGDLRQKRDELEKIDLPDPIKWAVKLRLTQIIATLEFFDQFGPDEAEYQLEALMARIAIQAKSAPADSEPFFLKLGKKLAQAYKGVQKTNKIVSESETFVNHAEDIIEIVSHIADKS